MWIFEITTGKLYDPAGKYVSTGYAGGNCGKNKEGVDNPAMENVPNEGPLPEGMYTFGEVVLQSHLGPFAIPLIPDPSNEMFGRGDFFCHGDTIKNPGCASKGCIIMPRNVREMMYNSDDKLLRVVKTWQP
jgi:hypothetical protein